MSEELLQILAAGLSCCGFALIFQIRLRYFPAVFIGGVLSWSVYLAARELGGTRLMGMLAGSMAVTLYSEIAARVGKFPAAVIYISSILPLIPGGGLYYTMQGVITSNPELYSIQGQYLAEDTLGIVLGSIIVLSLFAARRNKKKS